MILRSASPEFAPRGGFPLNALVRHAPANFSISGSVCQGFSPHPFAPPDDESRLNLTDLLGSPCIDLIVE